MVVGIPRALLYFRYRVMWHSFFEYLGVDIILSPESSKAILEQGKALSLDECCVPSKIFMGHAAYLKDKCDFLFVPRIAYFGHKDSVCVKFNALYDIVNNSIDGVNLVTINIDSRSGCNETSAYVSLGKSLGFSGLKSLRAYNYAKSCQKKHDLLQYSRFLTDLKSPDLKLLVVAHDYVLHDKFLGGEVVRLLAKEGVQVLVASDSDKKLSRAAFKNISKTLYWAFSKELLGAVYRHKDEVDGIVYLTAFPCGPDSLVNDLSLRRIKIPSINIILDDRLSDTGLATRIESFVDILKSKKAQSYEQKAENI